MRVLASAGKEDFAIVYIGETKSGRKVEFVESLQPPLKIEKKWILMVSTLFGCPVDCVFCDAGGNYMGKLSSDEIISQIDYMVSKRYPDRKIPAEKFKIQFARMGEPSFNDEVLKVLDMLPDIFVAPGLIPSFSTVAPSGKEKFFDKLLNIKDINYQDKFQLQFSIHTTDIKMRDRIVPCKKWNFKEIADYGKLFKGNGKKKVTLNFALSEKIPINPDVLLNYFSPEYFLIKVTPVNPTYKAVKINLTSDIDSSDSKAKILALRNAGYEVIESLGEIEENAIGSNCGQYLESYRRQAKLSNSYTYKIKSI